MKAIIACGGKGTRRFPDSKDCPKILLPYEDGLVIDKIFESIDAISYITELVFVLNSRLGGQIVDYVRKQYPLIGMKSSFIIDDSYQGFGYAVWLAKFFCPPNQPVMIFADDEIFEFTEGANFGHVSQRSVLHSVVSDTPEKYGVISSDDSGKLVLTEKPYSPLSNRILVGPYYFSQAKSLFIALDYLVTNQIYDRGEIRLITAIQRMIDFDFGFDVHPLDWKDVGS